MKYQNKSSTILFISDEKPDPNNPIFSVSVSMNKIEVEDVDRNNLSAIEINGEDDY